MLTTETTTAAKTAPVKKLSRTARLKKYMRELDKKGMGTVAQIIALHKKGAKRSELINEFGYNKNTVHRQVHEYELSKG